MEGAAEYAYCYDSLNFEKSRLSISWFGASELGSDRRQMKTAPGSFTNYPDNSREEILQLNTMS